MSNEIQKRPPPFKEIRLSPYEIWHIAEGPEGEECFVDQMIANEKAGLPLDHGIPPPSNPELVKERLAYYAKRDAERGE